MRSRWYETTAFFTTARNSELLKFTTTKSNYYSATQNKSPYQHRLFSGYTLGQIIHPKEENPLPKSNFLNTTNANENGPLACSRLGLDPSQNRFHAPLVYHEDYSFSNWPTNHTFPMDKFERLAYALTSTCKKTHPGVSTLSRPLVRSYNDFFRPLDIDDIPYHLFSNSKDLLLELGENHEHNNLQHYHEEGPIEHSFLYRFLKGKLSQDEERWIGFREQTKRKELITRTVLEVAGTILTTQLALQYGIASNAAGGTHHASPNRGAGYTILNDLAIAAHFLTQKNDIGDKNKTKINKVLIVDADVHQGDGTAKFYDLHKENRLITLSIHCQDNYPTPKANSTYDIGLKTGCRDEEYMEEFTKGVDKAILETHPDLVLYDAGVDVFIKDKLGRLKITEKGIRKRDRWLLERCVNNNIPVAAVIGGGYDKDVNVLARRHAIVHEECAYIWRKHKMWKTQESLK